MGLILIGYQLKLNRVLLTNLHQIFLTGTNKAYQFTNFASAFANASSSASWMDLIFCLLRTKPPCSDMTHSLNSSSLYSEHQI